MEQIENKMVLDEYWERKQIDWDKYYEHCLEESDAKWEDYYDED